MKKQLLIIVAFLLPMLTSADPVEIDGLYYNLDSDTNTAEVTGNPAYYRFYYFYNSYSGSIVIPNTVKYNGVDYDVKSIGDYTFYSCSGLTSVTIPNSVSYIGGFAFWGCNGLTSVNIHDLESWCAIQFSDFSNPLIYVHHLSINGQEKTELTIPNSVTSIGDYAFQGYTDLTSVTLPNSVTSIGNEAFSGCSGLTSVTIPNSVTSIGSSAFSGCSGLTSVTIPNSVTSIGSSAFRNCSGLTSVTIPNSVTSIEWGTFQDCYGLISVTIPNSVTSIGNDAFLFCHGLISVTIPNSVTSIGNEAFSGCSGLTSVTIPNSVTSIGRDAFESCRGLTSVTIPNSVTFIANNAFESCSGLESIIVENGNSNYDSRGNCNAIIESSTNVLITGCKNTVIPNNVVSIGYTAFNGCIGLTSITIPKSVTNIEEGSFIGCNGLESIIVENGNSNYDSRGNCNAIIESSTNVLIMGCKNTIIPNNVVGIGDYAFIGCKALTSITIPKSVTNIRVQSFLGCNGLERIIVENGNSNYDSRGNCNAIIESSTNVLIMGCKNTIIPNSVTSIGSSAFYGCTGLTSVTIGNSVIKIGEYAFNGCTSLISVTLPNSVISIGQRAFRVCSNLTSVTIPYSVTSFGHDAFTGCVLKSVVCRCTSTKFGDLFSTDTYKCAVLYIPEGERWNTLNEGGWYRFENIRETAMVINEQSLRKAYMLMDAQSFSYLVYDDVNKEVKAIDDFYDVNESVANNCWQIVKAGGQNCLYNIGAGKYAAIKPSGKWTLTDIPTPLSMESDEYGRTTINGRGNQWYFVLNEQVAVNNNLSAIDAVMEDLCTAKDAYYTLDGKRTDNLHKGLNIIKKKDGTTKKIVVE